MVDALENTPFCDLLTSVVRGNSRLRCGRIAIEKPVGIAAFRNDSCWDQWYPEGARLPCVFYCESEQSFCNAYSSKRLGQFRVGDDQVVA